jgi:hypothetical protein
MRARFIYEKFTEEGSDPIQDMGIGTHARIKKMHDEGKPGYYLVKAKTKYEKGWAFDTEANYTDVAHAKFLMYDPRDDDSLYEYIKSKLGEWKWSNSRKWEKFCVIAIYKSGEKEIYKL